MTTVLAPISWGTTYVTITELLPAGRPLLVAAMRVVPAGIVLLVAGAVVSPLAAATATEWWRTGGARAVQLRPLLPAPRRRGLPPAGRRRRRRRRPAAAARRRPVVAASPAPTAAAWSSRSACVAAVGVALVVLRPGAGLDAVGVLAAVAPTCRSPSGVVLTKRFPAPPNRLAATGWQLLLGGAAPRAAHARRRGSAAGADGTQPGRLRLPQPRRHGARVRALVQRHPPAADRCAAAARPRRPGHRRALGWVVLGQSLSPLQLAGFVVTLAAIA